MELDSETKQNIQVSFIIPMYNGKDFIVNCVSKLKQVDCTKEILIINDGSTDDSLMFCENSFAQDKEITIYSKENGGVASTRNFGLEKTKGKYIVFVDQDDQIVPDVVSKAIRIIESRNCQILFWDTRRILATGEVLDNTHSAAEMIVYREEIVEKVLPTFLFCKETDIKCELGSLWGAVFSFEFIQNNNIKFKRFVAYEDDRIFLLDALSVAECVYFLPEIGYYWFIREESTSHKKKRISNCVERVLELNIYRYNSFKKICQNTSTVEEYKIYVEQFIVLCSINYICTYYSWNLKEVKQIRKLLYKDAYIESFKKELVVKSNYAKMLYPWLKRKHDIIAYCLSYLNSIRNRLIQ